MSDQFNLRRFGRLFKKHTTEQYKSYLMSLVVLISGLSLMIGYIVYMANPPLRREEQSILFMFFMLGSGAVFTSTVFAPLGDKRKAIAALTLPASHFEKFLVGWVYSFVIFQLLFVASFHVVMPAIQNLFARAGQPVEVVNIFAAESRGYLIFVLYAFLHAFALTGSIYFEKLQFIKSGFALGIAYLILVLVNKQVLKALFNQDLNFMLPFGNIFFKENNGSYGLALPPNQQNLLAFVPLVLAVVFWLTAYVRLKEKQV